MGVFRLPPSPVYFLYPCTLLFATARRKLDTSHSNFIGLWQV